MIIDKQLQFADGQAITATAISANVIDLGETASERKNIAGGEPPMVLVVRTREACTDSGSDATLTITLESADNEALSSNPVVHATTGAMTFASFSPAGTWLVLHGLPIDQYRRYLGLRFAIAGGPLTGGSFDAFLSAEVASWEAYANGNVV